MLLILVRDSTGNLGSVIWDLHGHGPQQSVEVWGVGDVRVVGLRDEGYGGSISSYGRDCEFQFHLEVD